MDDKERRRHMDGLRAAAPYLNHLDTDDFADGAVHGETAVRWAVEEIERLDRLVGIYECREGVTAADRGRWDDLECDHDHSRSPLEAPRETAADAYQRRTMVMRQSWPTVTTDANGVVHFHDAYTIINPEQRESP